jgi:hypothetical protein
MLKLLLMERNILGVHKYKSVTLVIENYENIIANVNTNICELIRKCKNLLTSNKRWCYFSSDDFGFPYIQMKCNGDTTKFNIQHFMNPISRPPMQLYLLNGLIPDPDECPGLVQRLLVDLRALQDAENEAVALGLAELRAEELRVLRKHQLIWHHDVGRKRASDQQLHRTGTIRVNGKSSCYEREEEAQQSAEWWNDNDDAEFSD